MKTYKIEISSKTIVFSIFFILFLFFLWQIKDLIFSLFIGFILSGALKPFVDFLETKKIPRHISSFFVYVIFISLFFILFYLIFPPILKEMSVLFTNLPSMAKNIPELKNFIDFNFINNNLPNLTNNIFGFIKGFFSNIFFIVSTLFFGFYLLMDNKFIKKTLQIFYDDQYAQKINYIIEKGQRKTAFWFWGEMILMIVVGFLTYLGLLFFGFQKYALALAVLAGFLEIIPNVGPIISAIPAVIIGLSQSFSLGLSMIGLYIIVQQLENNLIVPLIMKKIVGVHPIISLMALLIGGRLAGVLGVLLSLPMVIFIETLILEWQKER